MIKQLTHHNIKELIALFVIVFKEDTYYNTMFPDKHTREQEIEDMITKLLIRCFQDFTIYGLYQDGKLIAFTITFDYMYMLTRNNTDFLYIFNSGHSKGLMELPYVNKLHLPILSLNTQKLQNHILFLLAIGVHPDYQQKGLGSLLIQYIVTEHKHDYIVSDISNTLSIPIYERLQFTVSTIAEDYYLVVRTPIKH